MQIWTTFCRPVANGDVRGLGVFITNGDDEREVGRVAFVRDLASKKYQGKEFTDQLDAALERADRAADVINDTLVEVERLQEQAEAERQLREQKAIAELDAKIKEAIGSSPRPSTFT